MSPQVSEALEFQRHRFAGLFDHIVAVDLTPPEEGFNEANYGGEALRQALLNSLPAAQAQTLRSLDLAQRNLQDLYARRAQPVILAYSTMAATAGALPIPLVDLVLISGIQTKMVYDLAGLYGQPLTRRRLGELTSALGAGLVTRQAGRSLIKLIPGLGTVAGSVAGSALAAAATYALGMAFCYYYRVILEGQEPDPERLRSYYHDQLDQAKQAWERLHPVPGQKATPPSPENQG